MPPMNAARRRALRAVLSALAGGGLTAASLGGPLTAAVAAETTTTTPEPTSTTTTETTTTTTPTETTTTPAPATTPTTTPTTTPASTTPAATTPAQTTTTPSAPAPATKPAEEAPKVLLRRRQRTTTGARPNQTSTQATSGTGKKPGESAGNNVALSPQQIAAYANALASTEASIQALGFYRIPLFLLPVYKAAAVQYGVPWQILAAINEIETNYGTDLSVSSAGAVGWMQFMPATWLQYGVDALNAGYADPYNPVDAVFAAARYLRAAGAANNLQAAILAYNHSQEYVNSVLLRAKLISAYPRAVIATLTGLVDGRLPVTGKQVAWAALPVEPASASSATAGATAVAPSQAAASGSSAPATGTAASTGQTAAGTGQTASGSAPTAAPSPTAAAAKAAIAKPPLRLVDLTSAPGAKVVAVQNGRIAQIGQSRRLGHFLVLKDVYGDVFTYAGLGSIATSYTPKPASSQGASPIVQAASKQDAAPSQAASAGVQSPLTLHVTAGRVGPGHHAASKASQAGGQASTPDAEGNTNAGPGKVRLFAHPGNPDARAAAVVAAANRALQARASRRVALKAGSVVPSGTVLGTVSVASGAHDGHIRFAIRPAGDPASIDPGPILSNWAQLETTLHPHGAKSEDALLGATAADVFLLSKSELERTVLSDPRITIYACGRHDVASGAVDKRVLALLAFLARSGLAPTVTALRCGQSPVTGAGTASASYRGDAVEISALNGTPIAGHQGAGTVTDLAIRTVLTLPSEFAPSAILSLMRYPGAPTTHASASYSERLRIEFAPPVQTLALGPATAGKAGRNGARAAKLAAVPLLQSSTLDSTQWDQLVNRIATLPVPTVASKPSSAAIPDPKHR
jgi:membrane-bound lytic murein transglycosylase B